MRSPRFFALILTLCMLAAAACGDDDAPAADAAGGAADASAADAPDPDAPVVTIDAASDTDAFVGVPDASIALACGNDMLEFPEQCDDGNHMPNDGCTPNCQVEADCGAITEPLVLDTDLTGDTTILSNVASGSCTGGGAGEQIYTITVYEASTLTVSTDFAGTNYDSAVYVRRTCGSTGSQLGCAANAAQGDTLTVALAPGTYFVFADGRQGAEGNYTLRASVAVIPILPEGMACLPDGTTGVCVTGTVCVPPAGGGATTCTASAAACLALAQPITLGAAATAGTTIGSPDLMTATCADDGAAGEDIYTFDIPAGTHADLLASVTPSNFNADGYDAVLSLGTACSDGAATLDCTDSPGASATEKVQQLDIQPGTYYLQLDGFEGAAGAYSLEAHLRPIVGVGATCDAAQVMFRCDAGLTCTAGTCQ